MVSPRWTVVVPTFDRPEALTSCLQALACQDVAGGVEVLVIDDGGARPAAPVVEALTPDFPHVLALHRQSNAGPAAARNAGAARATGRLLAFTDDDCSPEPGWLAELEPHLCDASVLVGGRTINALRHNMMAEATQTLVSHLVEPARGSAAQFFPTCNLAVDRTAFERSGGFDQTFPTAAGEDRVFCDAWLAGGGRLHYQPSATVLHRHHLTLPGFWRQHRGYGQAAVAVHRLRAGRGLPGAGRPPAAFYVRLLARPFQEQGLWRGAVLAVLLAGSQAATLAGYRRGRRAVGTL